MVSSIPRAAILQRLDDLDRPPGAHLRLDGGAVRLVLGYGEPLHDDTLRSPKQRPGARTPEVESSGVLGLSRSQGLDLWGLRPLMRCVQGW